MNDRLPNVRPKEAVRALERAGFVVERQSGSHLTMRHPVKKHTTVIPMHPGDLKRPLLKLIIKQAGLTEEQFRDLL